MTLLSKLQTRPTGALNTYRPLTRSLDYGKEGLAVNATQSEEWRPIPEWEGLFEVSNRGNVRTVARTVVQANGVTRHFPQKIRRLGDNPDGYKTIALKAGGRSTTKLVHGLVLETFVGPRPPGFHCCHYDGDPANNRIDNLRWDTQSSNAHDRVRHGRHNHANKTHCVHGHEYTPENTYVRTSRTRPGRHCRACARAALAERRVKEDEDG